MGNLRTNLRCITVNGLPSAKNQTGNSDVAHRHRERVTGSKRIGTGKSSVGKQVAFISSPVQRFAQYIGCAERSHRENRNLGIRVLIFNAQSLLQSVQIFRIEDCLQSRTIDRAVCLHGILPHIVGIGHLFG